MADHVQTPITDAERLAAVYLSGQIVGLSLKLPPEAFESVVREGRLDPYYLKHVEAVAKMRRTIEDWR